MGTRTIGTDRERLREESGGASLRHVGSVVLAALLLGVPRALDTRTFGAQRSVYVEVAPTSPELARFATELERAIEGAALTLASGPGRATLVVELRGVSTSRGTDGRPMEAASFVIRDGTRCRPVVLHYPSGRRARAARALLEELDARRS